MENGKSEWIGKISLSINSLSSLWKQQLPWRGKKVDLFAKMLEASWLSSPLGTWRQSMCVRVPLRVSVHTQGHLASVGNLSTSSPCDPRSNNLITDTFRNSSWLANNPRRQSCFDVSCWGGSLNIRTYLCSTAVISFDFLVWSWCFSSICLWKLNISEKKNKLRKREDGSCVHFLSVCYKLNSQIKRVYGFAVDLPPNH